MDNPEKCNTTSLIHQTDMRHLKIGLCYTFTLHPFTTDITKRARSLLQEGDYDLTLENQGKLKMNNADDWYIKKKNHKQFSSP